MITKSKLPRLEETIEKNRGEFKLEKMLFKVPPNHYKPRDLYSKVEAIVYPGERTFPIENQDTHELVVISRSFIRLVGLFPNKFSSPTDFDSSPSCLILFKSLMIRDCSMNFSEPYISEVLLTGLNSSIKPMERSFIRCYNAEYGYFVRLGNNSIWLNDEEVTELCEILDSYGEKLLRWKNENVEKYGVADLKPSNIYPGAYRLFRITRGLWRELINFSFDFEYSKGTDPWNVFEHSVGSFRVISRAEDTRFTSSFHAWIRAEQVQTFIEESLVHPDDYIWVIWHPSSLAYTEKEQYSFEGKWSAKITKNFLLTEMIPYAIYRLETKRKIFKKSFSKFRENFRIEDYVYDS